jgi:hypothetical protein
MCREALPSENNYRNLLSFGRSSVKARPTMEELREEEVGPLGVTGQAKVSQVFMWTPHCGVVVYY